MESSAHIPRPLTESILHDHIVWLVKKDKILRNILDSIGYPPLWARPPGFSTLVHIILEQQVSLASALAAFNRLEAVCGGITPQRFILLDDTALKQIGFSRQKSAYCRGLAAEIMRGNLDLEQISLQDEVKIREKLIRLKGIGPWTVDIYLLLALGRPDILPCHDLALAIAVQRAYNLLTIPSPKELETIGEIWRPCRASAVRLLWHLYLSGSKA